MNSSEAIRTAREKIKLWNPAGLRDAGLFPADGSYYPSIYYPPIPMYGGSNEQKILRGFQHNPTRPLSVYVHIPFCRSRCRYCHWVVHVGKSDQEMDTYLSYLEKEIALWKAKFGVPKLAPSSVLLGGGTPTALSARQTERLMKILHSQLDLANCRQITCETEPGSILGDEGRAKLKALREHGVERMSLGVQAFDDKALKAMGRAHSAADVLEAIGEVRAAGFKSLAIDLIYGFPGSNPENWYTTLQTAIHSGIDAFQLYRLRIVPHGDRVGSVKPDFDKHPEAFPSVEDVYVMKQLGFSLADQSGMTESTRRVFTKGADHASQYLKDHCESLGDVVGFGISSWSNVQDRFYLNTGESLAKYYEHLDRGSLPINRGKLRTRDDALRWAVVLSLKHCGVSKKAFQEITGTTIPEAFPKQIQSLLKHGLIQETSQMFSLTERGKFFADEVVIQFYHPAFIPFPKAAYLQGDLNPYLYNE